MSSSSSPNPQNHIPPWIALLVALEASSTVIAIYKAITQQLWQALIAGLVAVLIIPVLKKVLQQIQEDWAKQILTWIPSRWHMLKFQRHYFEQLRYKYHNVPTKSSIQGRYPLGLKQIFVSPK